MHTDVVHYTKPGTEDRQYSVSITFSDPKTLEFLSAVLAKGVEAVNPCRLPDGMSQDVLNLSRDLHSLYANGSIIYCMVNGRRV